MLHDFVFHSRQIRDAIAKSAIIDHFTTFSFVYEYEKVGYQADLRYDDAKYSRL